MNRQAAQLLEKGLYYLDWLMDHKTEFELLALKRFGKKTADAIKWTTPRLLFIAGNFTKYDSHAVQQINRNIELIRLRATRPAGRTQKEKPLFYQGLLCFFGLCRTCTW